MKKFHSFISDIKITKKMISGNSLANKTCANAIVESSRTFLNSTFLNGLHPNRTLDERKKIVDQLFYDMNQIVEADPTKWSSEWGN